MSSSEPVRSTGHGGGVNPAVDSREQQRLRYLTLALAWTTVTWNVIEAVVAVMTGSAADSVALVSFGLDSTIEVASALVVVWQFDGAGHHPGTAEQRERAALRLIGASFFALAYVGVRAVLDLLAATAPESSPVGIALAAALLVVMPVLAVAKSSVGHKMGSPTVRADGRQTLICTYLSVVLLSGLVLNAWWSWGWADPVAGLVIAVLAVREGAEAWNGESCCD